MTFSRQLPSSGHAGYSSYPRISLSHKEFPFGPQDASLNNVMATFDQPSELLRGIEYPPRQRRGPGTDLRGGKLPATDPKYLCRPSHQQLTEEDRIFYQVESGVRRNPFAAAGSITFQVIVLATLIIAPLYFTQTMPQREVLLTKVYLQPPAAGGSSAAAVHAPVPTVTSKTLSTPSPVPKRQEVTAPVQPAVTAVGVLGGVPGGVVGGAPIGVLSAVPSSPHSVPVLSKIPDPAPVKRIRVASRVVEANLIHDVPPQYPPEAGRARIEGAVVLLATIGTDGSVKDVRIESGLPILAQAAIDAVRQWRYKPYLIDGEPVEVDSRITINFTLSAS